MITSKQSWFIMKLMKELEELDSKYNEDWFVANTYYASDCYNDYKTTKREASEDIKTLLAEKEKFN